MLGHWLSKLLLKVFVLLFIANFGYQKIVDNEAVCGALGVAEEHCPYAEHTPGHDEKSNHVCINCPCNLTLFVSWDLYVARIYSRLSVLYYPSSKPVVLAFEQSIRLFRPPRTSFA
ncbi:hypothetical protein LEP1GSC050_4018 [Leptospira broomii serovar Hurstbridge str. 5399]|uniref:Uncharacterized protein n=1 Tax=Leptospira broomii serovar Hurstbridge str. 5399 TaxID=1049789 RepID=T0F9V2_9LEPT|nr:hypothetical protein [Leptospira broomii]EQA44671.1 hypothetical protein LEP1GSC050_4018 [Leptospira broomii serovar Hurstbridge str. 5399]